MSHVSPTEAFLVIKNVFTQAGLSDADIAWALYVANGESTFNVHARGDTEFIPGIGHNWQPGDEALGLFQLHNRGMLIDFYNAGYNDPANPWQQARFVANFIKSRGGGLGAWTPWSVSNNAAAEGVQYGTIPIANSIAQVSEHTAGNVDPDVPGGGGGGLSALEQAGLANLEGQIRQAINKAERDGNHALRIQLEQFLHNLQFDPRFAALALEARDIQIAIDAANIAGNREASEALAELQAQLARRLENLGFEHSVVLQMLSQAFTAEQAQLGREHESEENKLARENQLRLQGIQSITSLRQTALSNQESARQQLVDLVGQDPLRAAIAQGGGITRGRTPGDAFRNELTQVVDRPLPVVPTANTPLSDIEAQLAGLQNRTQLPPTQPGGIGGQFGLAGGGTMTLGTAGTAVLVGEGPSGEGLRAGTAEVLAFDDGEVKVIPLRARAQGGLTASAGRLGTRGLAARSPRIPPRLQQAAQPQRLFPQIPPGGVPQIPQRPGLPRFDDLPNNLTGFPDSPKLTGADLAITPGVAPAGIGAPPPGIAPEPVEGRPPTTQGHFDPEGPDIIQQIQMAQDLRDDFINTATSQTAAIIQGFVQFQGGPDFWNDIAALILEFIAGNLDQTQAQLQIIGILNEGGATEPPGDEGEPTGPSPYGPATIPEGLTTEQLATAQQYVENIISNWPNFSSIDAQLLLQLGFGDANQILQGLIAAGAGNVDASILAFALEYFNDLLGLLGAGDITTPDTAAIRDVINLIYQHIGFPGDVQTGTGAFGSTIFENQGSASGIFFSEAFGLAPQLIRNSATGQVFARIDGQLLAVTGVGEDSVRQLEQLFPDAPGLGQIVSIHPSDLVEFGLDTSAFGGNTATQVIYLNQLLTRLDSLDATDQLEALQKGFPGIAQAIQAWEAGLGSQIDVRIAIGQALMPSVPTATITQLHAAFRSATTPSAGIGATQGPIIEPTTGLLLPAPQAIAGLLRQLDSTNPSAAALIEQAYQLAGIHNLREAGDFFTPTGTFSGQVGLG